MKSEFTAIIEAAPDGGFWAICPEVSGAVDPPHAPLHSLQAMLSFAIFGINDRAA